MEARRHRRVGLWRPGLGLLLAATCLAGCRPENSAETQVLVIGDRLPRLTLPAGAAPTPADLVLIENAAQGLVRFDAAGNIAPGLAERWAVSDDGLSYVFRLQKLEWSDGRRVRARDVVRLIQRHLRQADRDPLRDALGAVREVVAMTDRVIAVELSSPRPHLLQILAQPELGLIRESAGAGPFAVRRDGATLLLTRTLPGFDGDEGVEERVRLRTASAERAVAAFREGRAELVLGGTAGDIAVANGARIPRASLRIDPVAGLFGLIPGETDRAADPRWRALLDEALDRDRLVASLGVPGLQPRASLLQPGLDGIAAPHRPDWVAIPLPERLPGLQERARALIGAEGEADADGTGEQTARPVVRVALPPGPGGEILLVRLQADWGALGLDVVRAVRAERPDFRWIDAVAPSTSPAWFLRNFRCDFAAVCSVEADRLLDAARLSGFAPQRNAFLADAEKIMRGEALFLPVAAPVRWSLVARGIDGFAENRFARHTLTGLRARAGTRD